MKGILAVGTGTEKAETLLLTGCHGSAEAGQVKECFLEEDIMCLKLY